MPQKIESYMRLLCQLRSKISTYQSYPIAFYRDEMLSHFQSILELAWDIIEEYLEIDCTLTSDSASTYSFLEKAASAGIIQDVELWNCAITTWNLISHSREEQTDEVIAKQICNDYLPLMLAFRNRVAQDITMERYLQLPAATMLEILKTDTQFNFRINKEAVEAFGKQIQKEAKAHKEIRKAKMIRDFGFYDPNFHIDPLPRHLLKKNQK